LKEQGDGDLGENVITEEGITLHRRETVMPRPVRSIFGEHSFEAFVYSRGPKQKAPALHELAPTQSAPPFLATQIIVLALFIGLTVAGTLRFRAAPAPAA
jgi:hypothetical protein